MSDICPTCDKPVYCAEKAAISGKNGEARHKHCLKCSECGKRLDSITYNECKGIQNAFYLACLAFTYTEFRQCMELNFC